MSDEPKSVRTLAEDRVSLLLNGGSCNIHEHPPLTKLEKLILRKLLYCDDDLRFVASCELDSEIIRESKKQK